MIEKFNDSRIVKGVTEVVTKMIAKQTIRLWTLSEDKKEFERQRNLFNGELKSVIDAQKVSEILRKQTVEALGKQERVFALHDPCDIRKPHAKKLENLGKVRDLNGQVIPGYSTFNTVCVSADGEQLSLSDITVYSNGDEAHYVQQTELDELEKKLAKAEKEQTDTELNEREKQIEQLVRQEAYINLRQVTHKQLRAVSESLKEGNEALKVCHVLDRQFEGSPYFEFIDRELKDEFVLRLKTSRNANEVTVNKAGKEVAVKLVKATLPNSNSTVLDKVRLNKRVYQQAKRIIEWGKLTLNDVEYRVVRITLLARDGKPIFKQPMLLLTNCPVTSNEDALGIYRTYLMRAKIEGVFKFVKNALGWEEFQVRDWESIKNLIATAFYVGGYFYEIEPELAHHPVIEWLCQLGGGKGVISKHYFLEGLKCLLIHQQVEKFRHSSAENSSLWDNALAFAT